MKRTFWELHCCFILSILIVNLKRITNIVLYYIVILILLCSLIKLLRGYKIK